MQNSEFGTMLLGSVMKIFGIWYNAKSQCYGWSSYVYCILYADLKRFRIYVWSSYMCSHVCNTMFYLQRTKYTNIVYAVMKKSSHCRCPEWNFAILFNDCAPKWQYNFSTDLYKPWSTILFSSGSTPCAFLCFTELY